MDFDDFALPPVNVTANSAGGSKSNRILGPDGQLYTQGEAARLGLIIRTACEACRNRKLKCSGTLPENGGCARCNSDGIQCIYSARAPIGRPKKRKAEDDEEATGTSAPRSSSTKAKGGGKSKAKDKDGSGHSRSDSSVRVKTEENGFLDSPHNDHFSPFNGQAQLPASPAQSDVQRHTPLDGHQAAFSAPHSFGYLDDALATSSASSTKLASTPTVWSQNHLPFAMTPSDTMTPHSVISPTVAPTSYMTNGQGANGQGAQSSGAQTNNPSSTKLPSLDDLSVAAFLQSLDTLEISPAELFQQQQQQLLFSSGTSSSNTQAASANFGGLGAPFESTGIASNGNGLTASSVEEWATSSAILQPGLSFAVPADFSWWDLGINGADLGSGAPSVSATPSTELSSMAFPTSRGVQQQHMVQSLSHSTGDGGGVVSHSSSPSNMGRPRRPTFSADQMWPRGADAGMGQGQIQHTIAATETGLGWSTLPGPSQLSDTLSSPIEPQSKEGGGEKSCCPAKTAKSEIVSPIEAGAQKASCCSSKPSSSSSMAPSEAKENVASCCAGKVAPQTEVKSCCSGQSTDTSITAEPKIGETDSNQIEMGPLSTSAAVAGSSKPALDHERKRHAALHFHHPSKVHCVPNPSGKGCTCLCDMSVALLSVKQVLRETDPHKQPSTNPAAKQNNLATDTIQLTLTASQAITAQCACSADCPTCQSDPSTEISASLMVSTALQIYARAVRILREGFAATAANGVGGGGGGAASFFGGLNVTIGTYKPSVGNAKKIALYAIKLELKDLRRALGKISRMAQSFGSTNGGVGKVEGKDGGSGSDGEGAGKEGGHEKEREKDQGKIQQGMNPIDQLVILKLYRQLTELLKTVEGLEDAA